MVTQLPEDLARAKERILEIARGEGMVFDPIVFEMIDYAQMNHIAAYGGFPTRYPHWRWGMEYDRLVKSSRYGLSKIYELVVNTNPVYAYLLSSNSYMDQKLVMAHVCGHADFFKNNIWFAHTSKKMMDQTANHGTRIRRHIQSVGQERVERFIDACLSLENLIDPHSPYIRRRRDPEPPGTDSEHPTRLKGPEYMDAYLNPPEYIEAQRRRLDEQMEGMKNFPPEPERDVLLFLFEHAPLEPWQRDVLGIVRDEAYYFAPQGMTKIMNEGWASYWHSKLMTERLLTDSEVIDYADHHSGTVSMQQGKLNPYKIGIELFRDIEDRWNRGRFGPEFDQCENFVQKRDWDTGLGAGREKIFEVRRDHNDVTFIDTFLTEEFCREQKLFTFAPNNNTGTPEIQSREFQQVKQQLLFMLTNAGRPFIYVTNANHANRGELCLSHRSEGIELDAGYAEATLRNLYLVWGRPTHVETVLGDSAVRIGFDGESVTTEEVTAEV